MMATSLKFVSLNIERSKHLHRILPFLEDEQPDVMCLQELMESDIPVFERAYAPCRSFGFGGFHPVDAPEKGHAGMGNGIFSRLPVRDSGVIYYVGSHEGARSDPSHTHLKHLAVTWTDFDTESHVIRIATTHFTWTPDGSASDEQRMHMRELLRVLGNMGEFVLSGDFNAPRHHEGRPGEIFGMLSSKYVDNIPDEYETSLDPVLHRAGPLPYVVDGLFSTPANEITNVRLVDGVSDHMAIVATISKNSSGY